MVTWDTVQQAADSLKEKLPCVPQIAMVLGSGLGSLADGVPPERIVPYRDVPHMSISTAPDHAGRFVCGEIGGSPILYLQGRLHGYEGYTPEQIAFPVYVLKSLGVKTLCLTNASGGICSSFAAGDFMLIEDQINWTGKSPLTGENDARLGTRFPDMTFAFSPQLRQAAEDASRECGVSLQRGVYCGVNGPQFETPAEIRAFRSMGADAVGMSTVFEVIAAAHCGLPVVAVSMITNMAAGVLMQPLSGEEVNRVAKAKAADFRTLMTAIVRHAAFAENQKKG